MAAPLQVTGQAQEEPGLAHQPPNRVKKVSQDTSMKNKDLLVPVMILF
jgi:hypothetical protein